MNNRYKRILLKLSGESLMGEKQYGIDEKRIAEYATQIKVFVFMIYYFKCLFIKLSDNSKRLY